MSEDAGTAGEERPAPRGIRPEEVARLIDEMRPVLLGARLLRVFDHAPTSLAYRLRFRVSGGKRDLLVSLRAGFCRFHFVAIERARDPCPSEGAAQLRELLQGTRATSIDQPGGDRVLRIQLERGRSGEAIRRQLILELFGSTGRLLVCADSDRRIEFVAGRGGSAVGELYRFPDPPRRGAHVAAFALEPRAHLQAEDLEQECPFHGFLAREMGRREQGFELAERRTVLGRRVARAIEDHRRLLARLAADLERGAGWESEWRRGELLKASLAQLRRGMSEVRLVDWFDPDLRECLICIDSDKTPLENVEAHFRRARKWKRSLEVLASRQAECAQDLARLAEAERLLADEAGPERLERAAQLLDSLHMRGRAPAPTTKKPAERAATTAPRGPRSFRSRQGFVILAGRSAAENDRVTFTIARGNDLFFHRAHRPGPHVILRVPAGMVAAPESIEDAAFLAAYLGGWRGPQSVPVHWAPVKSVRKPRGAPAGLVTLANEREFMVEFSEALRDRLLASAEEPG